MRKFNDNSLSRPIGISFILMLLFLFIYPSSINANYKGQDKDKNKTQNQLPKITQDPVTSVVDINNITLYVQNNGFHPATFGGSWSSAFPKGIAGGIFQEGIVWGGLVNDGQSPTLRVGGNTYFSGTQELDRLYRVRPDYLTADLTDDAANFAYFQNYPLDLSSVNAGDIQSLRDQYAKDWNEWPAAKGAPFDDVDGNGVYDPNVDIPGIPGASQTVFIHYNDAVAPQAYGSPPIGIEVTQTIWAYAVSNPLSNVIFKKVNIVYKGTANTPANATINDMYLVQWADPDVGQYTDDFAGCDTLLNMGFAYSSSTQDAVYSGFGQAPPALGYDFLQGVAQFTGNPNDSAIVNLKWRKGYKYVNEKPLTTFTYFAAGGAWSDPDGQDPLGTLQWYNLMRGFLPRPEYPAGQPFPANVGGTPTGGVGTYLLSGDPITGQGFVDGVAEGPGDRRIVNITGPFNMALGDTAEIVVALIGGQGSTNTSSVAVLKFNDIFAQYAYDQLFDLPIFPSPEVSSTVLDNKVILNWDNNTAVNVENSAPKGFAFQGYNVYQFPNSSFNLSEAVLLATYDIKDGVTTILDDQFDENSGLVLELPSQFGTDVGVQRFAEITHDEIRNQPLRNGQEYYFGVSAYGYNPEAEGEESDLPFKALESNIVRITAVPQSPTPGVSFGEEPGAQIEFTHATGTGDGSLEITVVDPGKTTGHTYEVFFTQQQEIRNQNGDWVPGSSIINRPLGPDTLTNVTVDAAAVYGPQSGTLELNFSLSYESPDFNWVDGVLLIFPQGTQIISAPNFTAGNTGSNYSGVIAPEVIDNMVMLGDSNRTANGSFTGGEHWTIIIQGQVPLDISWKVYDDGYSGGPLDAQGTTQVTDVGFASRLALYWNLRDLTTGQVKLQNRSDINGTDIFPDRDDVPTDLGVQAAPIVDGFKINVVVGYDAPFTISSNNPPTVNGTNLRFSASNIWWVGTNFTVGDFRRFGYPDGLASTSLPVYGGAGGTNDVNVLQQDLEFRFTGVLGDTVINGKTLTITKSGGSIATLFGASNYSLADHPLNPNPGTDQPIAIRVPFEVWNVDANQQVNLVVWDREGNPTLDGGVVWKQDNRVYTWVVNTPYSTDVIDVTSQVVAQNATWNVVFYESHHNVGDVVRINYDNPIQIGQDTYQFTTPVATAYSIDKAKADVEKINVFPNPYYGTHYREVTREGKYVTFSHLPTKATIRIFDLAGVLVRTIEKDDPSQFVRWNLQNNNNYPVASGIYVAYIDMPELGATKILKIAVIQEEQILRIY